MWNNRKYLCLFLICDDIFIILMDWCVISYVNYFSINWNWIESWKNNKIALQFEYIICQETVHIFTHLLCWKKIISGRKNCLLDNMIHFSLLLFTTNQYDMWFVIVYGSRAETGNKIIQAVFVVKNDDVNETKKTSKFSENEGFSPTRDVLLIESKLHMFNFCQRVI